MEKEKTKGLSWNAEWKDRLSSCDMTGHIGIF